MNNCYRFWKTTVYTSSQGVCSPTFTCGVTNLTTYATTTDHCDTRRLSRAMLKIKLRLESVCRTEV